MEVSGLALYLNIIGAVVIICVGVTNTVLNVIKIRKELRKGDQGANT